MTALSAAIEAALAHLPTFLPGYFSVSDALDQLRKVNYQESGCFALAGGLMLLFSGMSGAHGIGLIAGLAVMATLLGQAKEACIGTVLVNALPTRCQQFLTMENVWVILGLAALAGGSVLGGALLVVAGLKNKTEGHFGSGQHSAPLLPSSQAPSSIPARGW
eukprot:TRINITY_DN13195_c0_g1_i1.p1 TRINITY_DN13195_c0_g1~~TRINITY_DN13195_c0_g1_i1.p1  ORF type:complete len:162 (+),score=2.23 TRINITY_DN13195_c0_g1_i1:97-582(+)